MVEKIYLLATGSSINNINERQWDFLKTQNTIGISWFIKKNFETTFFYSHEHDQSKSICEHIKDNNWNTQVFLGTKTYINKTTGVTVSSVKNSYDKYKQIINCKECYSTHFIKSFNGRSWSIQNENPPYNFNEVWAKNLNEPLCGFRGTLMASINLCTILGFDEIVLCGVDLNNGIHFYESGKSNFEKRIMGGKYDPKIHNHSTQIPYDNSRGIVDGLKWVSKHINIKTASKESLLYKNSIEYLHIEEL